MNRRGFLQALFAVPVVVAPLLVPAVAAPILERWIDRSGGLRVVAVDRERGVVTLGLLEGRDQPAKRVGLVPDGASRFEVGMRVTFPSLEAMMRAGL